MHCGKDTFYVQTNFLPRFKALCNWSLVSRHPPELHFLPRTWIHYCDFSKMKKLYGRFWQKQNVLWWSSPGKKCNLAVQFSLFHDLPIISLKKIESILTMPITAGKVYKIHNRHGTGISYSTIVYAYYVHGFRAVMLRFLHLKLHFMGSEVRSRTRNNNIY